MTVPWREVDHALDATKLVPMDPVLCICHKCCCSLDILLAECMLQTVIFSENQTNAPWQVTVAISRVV